MEPIPTPGTSPQATPKIAVPLPKPEGLKNKRLVIGCVSALGCGLLLFLGILVAFIAFQGTEDNPIFGLFGVSGGEVVNLVITLTSLIFGVLTFGVFVAAIILIFKFFATKKIEKENRKKAGYTAFIAFGLLFFLIFIWIFAYLFLASKRTLVPKNVIITEPINTLDLSSPVTIKFDAGQIPVARKYRVLNFAWDFGDATERTGGAVQTHTYEDKGRNNGRFDVEVTINVVETGTGRETSQTFTRIVTVTNEKADIVIRANPSSGEIPLTVNFDASQTVDPDGEIQSYEWDLDEDGEYDDGEGAKVNYTYTQIGTYEVSLRVKESDGSETTDSMEIEAVASKNPVAVMAIEGVTENKLLAGTVYHFSAVDSTAKEGVITRYFWNFGDGSTDKTTRRTDHTFTQTGAFVVTLKVTDSGGREGIATKEFEIENPAGTPDAKIETDPPAVNGTITGNVPLEIKFDASESSDRDDDIVEYAWDFDNDGQADSANAEATHTYEEVGTFRATLTVKDATGKEGKSSVTIDATSPGLLARLKAEPTSGEIPLTVNFDASGSSYAGHEISSYRWKFADSSEEQLGTAKISHQYVQVGIFEAEVTVIGNDGNMAKSKVQINVLPVPLSACFTATPESGQTPLEVDFNPQCSTGTVSTYHWKFADLGESRDRRPAFTFENPGDYMIQLEITDNQNTVSKFEKIIRVSSGGA